MKVRERSKKIKNDSVVNYWDKYNLEEFLYELGKLSCRKRGLCEDLSKRVKLKKSDIKLLDTLINGDKNTILELGDLIDKIMVKNMITNK